MNVHLNIILLIIPIYTSIFINNQYSNIEEYKLREITMNSLIKIKSNLYMINYVSNYYLDDLLKFNNKDITDLIKFVKLKLGDKYNFNIGKINKGFACSSFNVYNKNNHNLFGRNFDYSYSPTFIVWTYFFCAWKFYRNIK